MIMRERTERSQDPGVPEALPRVLIRLRERVAAVEMDRVWIFPPTRLSFFQPGVPGWVFRPLFALAIAVGARLAAEADPLGSAS